MTQIDEPNQDTTSIDEQIETILKEAWRQGYYTNNNTDTSHFTLATSQIKALISDQVAKAVDKTLTDLEDFKQEVLESRGIPNPTYVGKKELQEWIDNRRATLNGVKNK